MQPLRLSCGKLQLRINLNKMKKYNINDYTYIQITERGWKHLAETVGEEYIKHCIKTPSYEKVINGETWYKVPLWRVFDLLPINFGGLSLFNMTVMFDDESLT